MNWIKDYFNRNNCISVSAVEVEAEMPARTLHNYLNGSRDKFPSKHLPGLLRVLSQYGLIHDGWSFLYDSSDRTFICEKRIYGKSIESVEVEEEGRSHFEYLVPMYREILQADPTEIEQFFE